MSEPPHQLAAGDNTLIAATGTAPAASATSLRAGSLGLRHAIVISVAVMSPAASIFFNTIPQAQYAGAAVPLCYVVGFVVALLVANQYSEFSRELPSSGSAYTFVSAGLGSGFGFLTGWIGLIAIGLGAPYSFVLMSGNLQTLAQRWLGLTLSWPVYYVVALGVVTALCYIGVRQSVRVDMTFLAFEIGICLVLAGIIMFHVGGTGSLSAAPFNPASVPAGGDLTVGVVLAVLSFIGFETAAALGEETRQPHRSIPRAVYGSMIVVGIFYIAVSYAATIGYGPSHMATGYARDLAPFDTLARRFGGNTLAGLIDLAGVLSAFGAALAIINGGARMLFAVARDGMLPRFLAWTHPTRATPAGAITLLSAIGLGGGIALGIVLSPTTAYAFLGELDALFVLLIYVLVNIACVRFFWRERRAQFSVVRNGIFPALGLLITATIAIFAVLSPGDGALAYIPAIVGCWLLLGVIVLLILRPKVTV